MFRRCAAGLALLLHASAVHMVDLEQEILDTDLYKLGDFNFCKKCNDAPPPTGYPAALMAPVVKSLHWMLGMNHDWLSACFVTTAFEYDKFKCGCKAKKLPQVPQVAFAALGVMAAHPVETWTAMLTQQTDISVRQRVVDGIMRKHVDRGHVDQVVILGAGFDTRPYRRCAGMQEVRRIYETDLQEGINLKKSVLKNCEIEPVGGSQQVVRMALDLRWRAPFGKLWGRGDFVRNGTTVVLCEHVYPYLDVFENMEWIRSLRDTATEAGGNVVLVLVATRGPRFDALLAPACHHSMLGCRAGQMPMSLEKANKFMRALGWEKAEGFEDLEDGYMSTANLSATEKGYVGVFHAVHN